MLNWFEFTWATETTSSQETQPKLIFDIGLGSIFEGAEQESGRWLMVSVWRTARRRHPVFNSDWPIMSRWSQSLTTIKTFRQFSGRGGFAWALKCRFTSAEHDHHDHHHHVTAFCRSGPPVAFSWFLGGAFSAVYLTRSTFSSAIWALVGVPPGKTMSYRWILHQIFLSDPVFIVHKATRRVPLISPNKSH